MIRFIVLLCVYYFCFVFLSEEVGAGVGAFVSEVLFLLIQLFYFRIIAALLVPRGDDPDTAGGRALICDW